MSKMKTHIRLAIFATVFAGLGLGYLFFTQASLKASGREATDAVAMAFTDNDKAAVNDFVVYAASVDTAANDSLYLLSLEDGSRELRFVSDEIVRIGVYDYYRAKYQPVGSSDENPIFVVISLQREGSGWEPFDLRLSIE